MNRTAGFSLVLSIIYTIGLQVVNKNFIHFAKFAKKQILGG